MTVQLLLVDDNPHERELNRIRIGRAGFDIEVSQAGDGEDCLNMLSQKSLPDLVLLDLQMPGLDGPETLQAIRQELRLELPVIVLSGSEDIIGIQQLPSHQGHLKKPLNLELLKRLLVGLGFTV